MDAKILLVEDDPALAEVLTRGLTEEGASVVRAADGKTARVMLAHGEWDLVLLDWWLPYIDGHTLICEFRDKNPVTPVLFLTARDEVGDRVKGLDAGADDYLCKPFPFSELLARVRALLRRGRLSISVLRHEGVVLDTATRQSWLGDRPLDLTAKESAILALFLRRPGEVLSRAEVYELVWGEPYDGSSKCQGALEPSQ